MPVTSSPEEPLGILFSDVARLYWRRLETAIAAAGLDFTSAEMRVLITVIDHPGLRQAALAERLAIEPMTLCGHLDRLAAKALVERRPDPDDRRAKLVHATATGAPTLARLRAATEAVRAAPIAGLAADEVGALRDLLTRVRANLVAAPEASR